jgi:hypothetical protein
MPMQCRADTFVVFVYPQFVRDRSVCLFYIELTLSWCPRVSSACTCSFYMPVQCRADILMVSARVLREYVVVLYSYAMSS